MAPHSAMTFHMDNTSAQQHTDNHVADAQDKRRYTTEYNTTNAPVAATITPIINTVIRSIRLI